jgi:PKD repeat protein
MMPQMSPGAMPSAIQMPKVPGIALQALPGYGVAPLTVGFMVSFPDPTVEFETWRWDFGDGQVSTLPPLMLFHTYAKAGSYVVTLTATTNDGLITTAQAGVIVRPSSSQ